MVARRAFFYHTTDPQNVEHMLKTNFKNYPKGRKFYVTFHDLLGEGIFNVDGAGWLVQRKTASHEFSMSRFKHFMSDVFLEHLLELCEIIGEQQGRQVDLQRLFTKFTLESIGKIAYGVQLGCLRRDMPFERCFDQATHCSTKRVLAPWWRLQKALCIGNERTLASALREINDFSAGVIAQRRALSTEALARHCDLLSRFMQLRDETGETHSDSFLRDIVVNFTLAGRDTTANCLSWLFLLLGRHPAVLQELRAEVMVGLVAVDGAAPPPPSFEAVHHARMPYLHAVVTGVRSA